MAMRGPTAANFKFTKSQMRKLANACKNGTDVTLRLNKNMITADGIPLALTATKYKKIQNGNTHDIKIGASRVKRGCITRHSQRNRYN